MKTFPLACIITLLLLFSISGKSYAQTENLQFEHLSSQQGLSQNSVWSICQDSEGFMWFGTQDGLNKYDGYTFTAFKPNPDDPEHTLHHNIITDIHEDRKGRLWVATFGGGLHQVDKHTGSVTRYGINPADITLWNVLASIYEDQQGILWISGSGGVASFNPETKKFTLYGDSVEELWIASVAEDSTGQLWAGGSGGVYQLDRNTGKYTPFVLDSSLAVQPLCSSLYMDKNGILWAGTEGEGLFLMDTHHSPLSFTRYNPGGVVSKSIRYNGIYEDNSGYLWLSGSEGLQRIDKKTDEVQDFKANPLQPGSLSHHNVSLVYQDRAGTLWIGTDHGVNKVTAYSRKFRSYQIIPALPSAILHENTIGTLLEDHTGKMWLGSAGASLFGNFANGLYQFDPKSKEIKHFPANATNPDSLVSNQVWSLYEDQKNRLWIGTQEALHLLDRNTGKFRRYFSDIPVECIDEDPSGELWIGGTHHHALVGGIASFDPDKGQFKYYKYDPKDTAGLKEKFVRDIMVSHSGDIWIATWGSGITRLNQQTDQFTSYLSRPIAAQGHLNDKDVRVLYEDEEGVIWAGTNQGGLHRYDSLTSTFTYFTIQDGLPSNHIVSIIGDDNGNLWLGTNKGLSCFNPKATTFRNFDVNDGLPANEFTLGSVYSRNGRLMFGTVNGFIIFHPDSIQENTVIPPVYITGFKVLEKSRILPEDKLELPYDENFLSFEFVALNYDAPEKNQYAYRLEGVDKDWVYSGTRRFASYTDLDPGQYTFRVKASNNDGVWNEGGASIKFTILPPWWQTWWAYSLYGLLALGTVLSIRHYEMKRLKLRQRAEHLSELDHLKTRFFANISHEFRTPLTLILGPLEKLLSQPAYAQEHSLFSMMQRNAQRLLHLINQLLDLSKLEAGSMKLEPKPADIVSFIKATVLSFTSLAEKKQIQYQVQYPLEHPIMYFDADKLEKILTNLLSNAFKFTPVGGKITVTAEFTAAAQKALPHMFSQAEVSKVKILGVQVQDSGTGIAEQQQAKIFDRFYQSDTSPAREQEGSGIGLSLVKELVELHEGEIAVESKPEKGSCFIVRLPLLVAEYEQISVGEPVEDKAHRTIAPITNAEDEEEAASKPLPQANAEAPLVLIIEDNADIRQFIKQHLHPFYQAIEASDGVEGYSKAVEAIPDLILSDVMMPRMDGVTLCQKLKSNDKTAHVPVILLTAKASGADKIEGLETGADDYIIKPFEANELLVRIRNLIESRKKLREHYRGQITVEPKSITVTSVDEQFLQRVMQIMEVHISDTAFSVEALGLEVGMSRMQLHRKLKALTDQSPGEFIRSFRLKRAAMLLSQHYGNISEVAFSVGFQEPSYFAKCFREEFGQAPSEYLAGQAPTPKS